MEFDESLYTPKQLRLLTRALTPVNTSAGVAGRVRAFEELLRDNVPLPEAKTRTILGQLAEDPLGTYASGQAARKSQDLLDSLDEEFIYPSTTPDAPADPHEYWPYRPTNDPFADLDRTFLFEDGLREVTEGDMDAARVRIEGAGPWPAKSGPTPS